MQKPLEQWKINEIKQLSSEWKSQREIAKILGVGKTSVARHQYKKEEIKEVFSSQEKKKLDLIQQYTPEQLKEILYRLKLDSKQNIEKVIWEPWYLKFWLVSDTHLGNKECARNELWEFYDIAKSDWVECFMHWWDIVDWDSVYTGQIYEQDKIGFDSQLEDIIKSYPNIWLDTYFIGGNHDESFLKKTGWDISRAISEVRKDLINLGFYDARIKLNGVDINLHHGGWGMSYAKSYKIQKLLENIDPKNQPNVFAAGHRHTALYVFYRKIHSFLPWAFLKENLLAKRFNLDNTIGGWIIEVEIDKTGWTKIGMKFIKL